MSVEKKLTRFKLYIKPKFPMILEFSSQCPATRSMQGKVTTKIEEIYNPTNLNKFVKPNYVTS